MIKEKPIVIVHISDFHAGSQFFVPNLISRAVQEVNELNPQLVIATGDLTDNGFRQEYKTSEAFLSLIKCQNLLIVPGNHDSRNVGFYHFEELFGERNRYLNFQGLAVIGLDSTQPDLDDGSIGRERYKWITKCFKSTDEFKIVALHHHLIPVPGTGRERNIIYDAGDLLEVLIRNGTNMVLSGHKHVPHIWQIEDMILLNAGTVSSLRLRGNTKPCYNIIELYEKKIVIFKKYPFGSKEMVMEFPIESRVICSLSQNNRKKRG